MAFHVGQHVVCVEDRASAYGGYYPGPTNSDDMHGLRRGTVYTVREARVWPGDQLNVWLFELRRPIARGDEPGYAAERFRPVDESRLAIFRQALQPVKEDA